MSKNTNIKMLKYIYKHIDSHIFINFFFVFNRNAFDAYFRTLYTAVRNNIPQNTLQNIDTTFYNNNFSTAVGYVRTKMGREDIRDAKKPYATTNIYNPGAQLPVILLYTNPLQIGKLLQLQQWPNCPQVGGACHQPHILCKPDMAIVLEEIQFQPPAQAQVAGQPPPGCPGGPAQAPLVPLEVAVPLEVVVPLLEVQVQVAKVLLNKEIMMMMMKNQKTMMILILLMMNIQKMIMIMVIMNVMKKKKRNQPMISQDDTDEYYDIYDEENDDNHDVCASW